MFQEHFICTRHCKTILFETVSNMWRIVLVCAPSPASCRRHPVIMNHDLLTSFICVSEVTRVRSARFLNLCKARLEPFPRSNGHTARNFKFFCIPWRSWLWSCIRMLWCSHASINHNLKGYIHKNQMYLHNLSIVLFGGLQPGWCLSLWFFYRSWVFCLPGETARPELLKSSPHPQGSLQSPLPSAPFAPLQQHLCRHAVIKHPCEAALLSSTREKMSLFLKGGTQPPKPRKTESTFVRFQAPF